MQLRTCLFLTMLLSMTLLRSQEPISVDYVERPLKEVLRDLERKAGVLFSFSEELVRDRAINIQKGTFTLGEILSDISVQTGLILERISGKQIILKRSEMANMICGTLVDADNGETLPFATVYLEGSGMGTTTDSNGDFTLKATTADPQLRIQYIGYADLLLPLDIFKNGDCQLIKMTPQVQNLQEVVILGYITKGVHKNTDGSLTMVKEEMGLFPGQVEPDILQSLQYVPGIASLDESASGIQIRGGSPDQNLIFFDGVKMYNTGHFFGMISSFNPYIVESAKIYKGGAPPVYGDRVSGVIDISSGEKVPQHMEGGFGINGTHADFFLKAPLGNKVGATVSARRSYTDMFQTPTFDALSEKVFQNTKIVADDFGGFPDGGEGDDDDDDDDDNEQTIGREEFFFQDANARVNFHPTDHDHIALSGLYTKNQLDFTVTDDGDLITDRFDIENKGGSIKWKGGDGKLWTYGLGGNYTSFDSDYGNSSFEDMDLEERTIRRNTVEDMGAEAEVGYTFLPNSSMRLGYQFSRTEVFFQLRYDEGDGDEDDDDEEDGSGTNNYNELRQGINNAHTVYGEYRYNMPNKGLLSLGARATRYSVVTGTFIEPRINLEYPLLAGFRIKGTFEKRYQPISQLIEFEDVQLRLENGIWTLSNGTDLPVLESEQFSAGTLVQMGGFTLDVDVYGKRIKGLTSFTNGFNIGSPNLSTGYSDIKGIDVLLKKKFRILDVWAGYTYNKVDYHFPELQEGPFPGNNDITHNLQLSNTLTLDEWQFSLGWNYRTGSPFTLATSFDPISGNIDYGEINAERLPDFHRLDASAMYSFDLGSGSWRGELGASLKNLYSRQVPVSIYYRVDTDPLTGERELNQLRQLSLGATPNLVLRFYF